jgi:hypothetical protein
MADSERQAQGCDRCGQVDTHPRHTVFFPGNQEGAKASADVARKALEGGVGTWGLQDLLDPTRTVRHFDCCAEAGCEVCKEVLDDLHVEQRHGDKLIAALTEGA